MNKYDLEDVVAPISVTPEPPLKDWRLKFQSGTLRMTDFTSFFIKESRKYFHYQYEQETDASKPSLRCSFKENEAREGIIDVILEFMLGDNPNLILDKLKKEGNMSAVCGKVFKSGEPTYSCRECGMDPTCVLCVNCFKQSAHRFHKYKMSTSGGGGCCDCGDEEAWKKHYYCEEHLRKKETFEVNSSVITGTIKERCEIVFSAILTFCVNFLEIETNASLECLDGDGEGDDCFCTVLYNDESHTFDQVIQTLTKIAKCRHKDAMEIVSAIDREGRAVVKCDTFGECSSLKEAVEKQSLSTVSAMLPNRGASQSLRVSVLHIRAVSCQQFALQLLTWFQEFLMRHHTFRQIFASAIMDKKAPYNIRHILEYDVKLWKTARTCWHRVLIAGMLLEYDNKMTLAREFSRHYATIMQDFIRDDHDHSFSIVSMSVQLFTVPSIAHYLIANESIFFKLLHTFYHESVEKYIQNKTLHFAKNMSSLGFFKRAAYILYDLRYILSFKPDVWTDALRAGFLEGCKALLRLLNVMQGMEAATRQTGQHMDYEPEWECAFNLHIKLATTISLVLDWCATDHDVLVKLYQMVMRYMVANGFIVSLAKIEERSVAGHVANCHIYDVSSRPVSIHLPLSRFFAGIYLHLSAYGLTFDNVTSYSKRTPEEIIEPILCAQAMVAQVHAGMWRRNGYSLLHQLFFYRNVRCRGEMLDRDIAGMQIGAALIESNQYLIHILNKFNLLEWIQPDYEEKLTAPPTDDDFIRQLSMIDEFLELLIVIIGERYMPGIALVNDDDRLKKEIIQLLCVKNFSHSELHRGLPDTYNETALEELIEAVADFKKPLQSESKGYYQLRDGFHYDYNVFFYHYTKEEKSKSEETQRLRHKQKKELVCCPPPNLPKLTDGFVSIANLLQCDVMMAILSAVINRALDLKAKSFQENHLQKVLHLIGYGLQEEQTGFYPFLSFSDRVFKWDMDKKLEELQHSERVEAHRDFIIWVLNKCKEIKIAKNGHEDENNISNDIKPEDGQNMDGTTTLTTVEKERQEKEERSRLAAARRAKIMEQMHSAQKSFMKSNSEMFANDVAQKGEHMECDENEEGAVAYNSLACLGVERRLQQPEDEILKCILCFEDCKVTKEGPTLVYSAFLQKSKILPSTTRSPPSIYATSCGHVMHANCWQEYYNNEESKEQRRPHRSRLSLIAGAQQSEFQCPYCRYLCNTVLPLTAPLSKYSMPNVIHAGDEVFPIDLYLDILRAFSDELNKFRTREDLELWYEEFPDWDTIVKNSNLTVDLSQFANFAQAIKRPQIADSWLQYEKHYVKSVRRFAPGNFEMNEQEGLFWTLHSCVYTIKALEVYLRALDKPLKHEMSIRHKSCLSGLIRASCLYSTNFNNDDLKNLLIPIAELLDTLFSQKRKSVLEWNCFNMLSSILLMVPNLLISVALPSLKVLVNGSMMDFYTLEIFFLANMVKAIVLFEAPIDQHMDIDEEDVEIPKWSQKVLENISNFYKKYNISARRKAKPKSAENLKNPSELIANENDDGVEMTDLSGDNTLMDNIECNPHIIGALFEYIKTEMREFLRCCCLFFHYVTDVDFIDELSLPGSDTYENMCKYLGLQTGLDAYFNNESCFATILELFASHPHILNYDDVVEERQRDGDEFKIVPCVQPIPTLVELPEDYSDLINSVSDFICPNNEREEMKTPTMCLTCGEILCGQSYCCQPELDNRAVGACTYHANFCGAELGLFLRIRDCQIVYLGNRKGCFVQAPYLDEYGETDQGLRRGNPLRLCPERYRKIHLSWLSHGLHEEIARLNDNNTVAVTQWHHM